MYSTVSSSVTFTLCFSGGVGSVEWGVKSGGNQLDPRLVTLSSSGTPPTLTTEVLYSRRVSGSCNGDASSGQAIFILSNIRKEDKGFYGFRITSSGLVSTTIKI